jgi:hypothetical protein
MPANLNYLAKGAGDEVCENGGAHRSWRFFKKQ